jgi:hypothetical protein
VEALVYLALPMLPTYVDVDEILGFQVWLAELELLAGRAKASQGGTPLDALSAFELLQKLSMTIGGTDRTKLKEHQRECESLLFDILLRGAPPPVSSLPNPIPRCSACIKPAVATLASHQGAFYRHVAFPQGY